MSVNIQEFKPLAEGLAKVYGKGLSPEAIKVWFSALRGYSRQEISEACNLASMSQRMMPTPLEVQAIARDLHRQKQSAKFKPFTLGEVRPATDYGRACIAVVGQVLAGDMARGEGVRRCFSLAQEMSVDLYADGDSKRREELSALESLYSES